MGTPRVLSLWDHRDPQCLVPKETSYSYGVKGTSRAPFPWRSPKSDPNWAMGTPRATPAAAAGPVCPVPMDSRIPAIPGPGDPMSPHGRTGGPCGVPTLRGDPPCPSRGPGAPSLLSLPAPAGRQRRAGHGDTRGRCHFRAGCANTASADLRPLTHTRAPHKGRVQEGPPKPSSPSPHCFPPPTALFSLSPKSH